MRIDNADRRLTPHGRRVGLISDAAWADHLCKQERLGGLKQLLERTKLTSAMLERIQTVVAAGDGECCEAPPSGVEEPSVSPTGELGAALGQPLAQLLKRPEIAIEALLPVLFDVAPQFFARDGNAEPSSAIRNELRSVEIEIKYEGYLQQQQRAIDRLKKAEQRTIPEWFDYRNVSGLSREMQEKLLKIRPRTLGHASRIPGVTPAAVSLVNVYIEIQARRREQAAAL